MAVFGAMALVLIVSGATTYWMGVLTIRRGEAVAHRQGVIDLIQDGFSTVQDAETGQRGYLLTENDSYLKPYKLADARESRGDLTALEQAADVRGFARGAR